MASDPRLRTLRKLISDTNILVAVAPGLSPRDRDQIKENLRAAVALTTELLGEVRVTAPTKKTLLNDGHEDLFLVVDDVHSEEQAAIWSVNAALGHNHVYSGEEQRDDIRAQWRGLIREESRPYANPTEPISDAQHCAAIRKITDKLSLRFGSYLIGGRLRYGTSQKAFNLYLKYLWRLGEAATPPHCPVDRVVLEAAGIDALWTKSDSEGEYRGWINLIRKKAWPVSLAEWEHDTWLQWRMSNSGQSFKS